MNGRRFALQVFPPAGPQSGVEISGEIVRRAEVLSLTYLLQGRLGDVQIPAPLAVATRRDRLWEETCFECFLAVKGRPQYWEFNLSPAGSWNVYQFTDYRQRMAEGPASISLPFDVQSGPGSLRLTLQVELTGMVSPDQTLEVAIAAVLRLRNGETTYWALTHPGPQPDFHRRDSFLITL
jgi:hypothetical protein